MDPQIIYVIGAFIIMLLGMGYVLMYAFLQPVWPYLSAKFGHKDLLLLADANGRMKLMPVKYSSETFTSERGKKGQKNHLILKWFLRQPTQTFALGDVRCALACDALGIVMDPESNRAIEVMQQQGLKNFEDFYEAYKAGEIEEDDAIETKAIYYVPVHRVLSYTSNVKPSSIAAEQEEFVSNLSEDFQIRLAKMAALLPQKSQANVGMWITIFVIIMMVVIGYWAYSSGAFNSFLHPRLLLPILNNI